MMVSVWESLIPTRRKEEKCGVTSRSRVVTEGQDPLSSPSRSSGSTAARRQVLYRRFSLGQASVSCVLMHLHLSLGGVRLLGGDFDKESLPGTRYWLRKKVSKKVRLWLSG